jgi:hypothetical protein
MEEEEGENSARSYSTSKSCSDSLVFATLLLLPYSFRLLATLLRLRPMMLSLALLSYFPLFSPFFSLSFSR